MTVTPRDDPNAKTILATVRTNARAYEYYRTFVRLLYSCKDVQQRFDHAEQKKAASRSINPH